MKSDSPVTHGICQVPRKAFRKKPPAFFRRPANLSLQFSVINDFIFNKAVKGHVLSYMQVTCQDTQAPLCTFSGGILYGKEKI